MFTLRAYREDDCAEYARLFYDTVHKINIADYTRRQVDAWADGQVDLEAWNESFLAHHTVTAEAEGRIVGFGDIDDSGYLDRLYVHSEYQRRGIATAICDELEAYAASRVSEVTTHASITAKPFFLRRGYEVVREQSVLRRGVYLTNFVMSKRVSEN